MVCSLALHCFQSAWKIERRVRKQHEKRQSNRMTEKKEKRIQRTLRNWKRSNQHVAIIISMNDKHYSETTITQLSIFMLCKFAHSHTNKQTNKRTFCTVYARNVKCYPFHCNFTKKTEIYDLSQAKWKETWIQIWNIRACWKFEMVKRKNLWLKKMIGWCFECNCYRTTCFFFWFSNWYIE